MTVENTASEPTGRRSDGNGDAAQASMFQELAARWKRDTEMLSRVSEIVRHPAYQEIIAMGAVALPLVLQDLESEPNHWFSALEAISGENPVPAEARGNITGMRDAWLNWGRRKGHLKRAGATSSPSSRG